ncbi:response regulator [Paenibacillus alkalitolerans]|uniref:response regulator n=1 Tax=Paenibacillus alkalitolerans TaxID=2799335 RepID=UPI0018F6235B|nr:response regulator [Paenibacillus alkalitolerans]
MAFSVLLVDDESIDLKWMKERIQRFDLPLRAASAVTSPFAALDVLQRERIDIVLSDIRMPILSGIEFARKAKEILPNVKIVFISGHQDFENAREAIHMGASGYLLKPVDDSELRDMLRNVCEQIEREQEGQRSVSEALSLVNRELLLRWLNELAPSPVDWHLRGFLDPLLKSGCVASLIEIDDLEWKFRKEEERRMLACNIAKFVDKFASDHHLGMVARVVGDRFLVLSSVPEKRFILLLQELIAQVNRTFKATITVGMGDEAKSPDLLHASYRKAQAALGAKWLLGKNRLVRESPAPSSEQADTPKYNITAEKLLQAILAYDLVTIDDCLLQLFQPAFSSSHRNDVYDLIIRLTSKLHADLLPMNVNLYEIVRWESHQPGVLFEFETLEDVLSWLRKRFFELSELLYRKNQNQKRKLIDDVIRHVTEQGDCMLTLKEVADHFNFTPNYLGQLFKEEAGMRFTDFLQEWRMKRVCALLRDPSMKIYEVADRAGYKNMIHFNRHFKLSSGMTPSEYRKKHRI